MEGHGVVTAFSPDLEAQAHGNDSIQFFCGWSFSEEIGDSPLARLLGRLLVIGHLAGIIPRSVARCARPGIRHHRELERIARNDRNMARWPRYQWTTLFTYLAVFLLFPILCYLAYAWVRGWIF